MNDLERQSTKKLPEVLVGGHPVKRSEYLSNPWVRMIRQASLTNSAENPSVIRTSDTED
ncbi:hypothetical protein ACFL0Y_04635 [Patescibacteria group bacterium]